jgi:hypothetical protein
MPDTQTIQQTYHVPGTLGADLNIRFTAPCDMQLIHISAVGSGAAAAGLSVGTSSSATAYLAKSSIGVSGTPVEFDFDNFATYSNKAYPRITDGTVVVLALDYDYNNGGAGSASADVTIVLTFLKG